MNAVGSLIDHTCMMCFKSTSMWCSRCQNVWYCSPEHLQSDWPRHRLECVPIASVGSDMHAIPQPVQPRLITVSPMLFAPREDRSRIITVNCEPNPRHACFCGASFTQRQGLMRHFRTAHDPKSCLLCNFKWGRRYEYRNHIIKKHPGVNPEMVLGKPAGSRRRATAFTGRFAQQQGSLPAIEQDRQKSTRFQPYSLPLPLPSVAGVTSVSLPAMPSMACNLRLVHPGPAITMDKDEYAPGSEFRDAPDLSAKFHPTAEHAELVNDSDDSCQDRQLGHAVRLLSSAHVGRINCRMPPFQTPIPTLAPPAGERVPLRYTPFSDKECEALLLDNSTF